MSEVVSIEITHVASFARVVRGKIPGKQQHERRRRVCIHASMHPRLCKNLNPDLTCFVSLLCPPRHTRQGKKVRFVGKLPSR